MPLFKDSKPIEIVAYTDGACRGNPGPAAAATALSVDGQVVAERSKYLGKSTNNRAEYEAVILALKTAAELNASVVTICTDSQLIARQITGRYKINNADLLPLRDKIKVLAAGFKSFKVIEIPREQNKLADGLANKCLDSHR
jgi:ribonuclease HI